jgi:hypothetical protein
MWWVWAGVTSTRLVSSAASVAGDLYFESLITVAAAASISGAGTVRLEGCTVNGGATFAAPTTVRGPTATATTTLGRLVGCDVLCCVCSCDVGLVWSVDAPLISASGFCFGL